MCLATDVCLTADPGVASLIPARSHTFVEFDHEIISTAILLPSAESFNKSWCQLQAKVCAQIQQAPDLNYSKTCLKWPVKKEDQKLVFKTNYRLMQVKSIAECSRGSILQYFQPSLSYHSSSRPLFCLFLSGRLRQVLL